MYIHVYIMLSALQVTNTLNDYGFTTEQSQGITVILDEYRSTLVTKTDLTNAVDKLSQRIEQVAAQVVQLEKNNTIRFEAMEKSNTARFEAMNDRFEAMNDRFEAINKRFEQMEKNNAARFEQIEKRFEQIEKRFEQTEKRFEQMQENMNIRFEAMEKSTAARFESVDKQLSTLRWFQGVSIALLALVTALLAINIF